MLSTYQNINLNGFCINAFTIWIIMIISMGIFCIGLGTYFNRRFIINTNLKTITLHLQKLHKKIFWRHQKIKYYETKLLFFISKAFIFWVMLLGLILYFSYKDRVFVDLNEYFYNYYADELQKTPYEEQALTLERIQNEINQKTNSVDTSDLIIVNIQNDALDKVRQDLETVNIIKAEKRTCTFLNQVPWEKFLNFNKLKENIILVVYILLVLILPMISWCLYEQKNLILSTFGYLPGIRKKQICGIQVRCIYGFLIWLTLLIKNFIPIIGKYELYGWNYYCSCLLFLPKWTNSLPIYGYYALIQLLTLLLMMIIANLPHIIFSKLSTT